MDADFVISDISLIIVDLLIPFSYRMTNTAVDSKDLTSLYSNCCICHSIRK